MKSIDSIGKKIFLDNSKIKNLCLITEVDNMMSSKDCRPILILLRLSKVYERLSFYNCQILLGSLQFKTSVNLVSTRLQYATSILLKYMDDIQKNLNRNEVTTSILIDIPKIFNKLNLRLYSGKYIA